MIAVKEHLNRGLRILTIWSDIGSMRHAGSTYLIYIDSFHKLIIEKIKFLID